MAKDNVPVTQAVRALRAKHIPFEPHPYNYLERGGTAHSSAELGVEEHCVVKTLVMETDARKPLVVLMHGDMEVSTKQLARILGVKSVTPCTPETANKHSGYMVGGTSPFGTKIEMPVYVERTIFDLPKMFINGGKRGFLVSIDPADLRKVLKITEVEIGIKN